MTDIEVGSLWEHVTSRMICKVVAVTEKHVFTEYANTDLADNWERGFFIGVCRPYATPPKEYKVWVYEDSQGVEHVCLKEPVMFKKIKSILTGREGDGL